MNRVIVSSPYSGDTERNVRYARECVRHSFDQGEAPFASHLLYTQPEILNDSVPRERERGVQAALEWITTCDLVAFYIDYGWSPGMIQELKVARLYRRKIELRAILMGGPKPPVEVKELLSYWNLP